MIVFIMHKKPSESFFFHLFCVCGASSPEKHVSLLQFLFFVTIHMFLFLFLC